MNTTLISKIEDIRNKVAEWQKQGLKIGLIPTMGALHKGHESLIKKASEICDKIIVSVFVNPIQFGPNEDYDRYPKTIEKDKETCEKNNVDIVFAPNAKEMYGDTTDLSNKTLTFVYPPYNLVDKLCGKTRSGHFDGVATVVLKLFNIVQPNFAFFGQKDAQQLIIIEKMVNDLNIPTTIVPCPIVREEDGLALSSRNQYLTKEAREKALSINKSLSYIKKLYEKGTNETKILLDSSISVLDEELELEYLEFVNLENLENTDIINKKTLVAIAAKIDNVRLIDNIIIGKDSS